MINKGEQRGVTERRQEGALSPVTPRMLPSERRTSGPSVLSFARAAEKFPNPRIRIIPQALPPADNKKAVPGCSEHDFSKSSSAVLTPMVTAKQFSAPLTAQRFPTFRSCVEAQPRASSACAERRSFWNARRFSARRNGSNVFCRTRQTALQAKPACVGIFRAPD